MNKSDNSAGLLIGLVVCAVLWKIWGSFPSWSASAAQFGLIAIGCATLALVVFACDSWNRYLNSDKFITTEDARSVYLGINSRRQKVHLKEQFRSSHAQIIGTTNAGKTESIILPWAIRDIENDAGILIIDGKGDRAFLDKLYAYVKLNKKEDKFRLFSLVHFNPSSTFNPLMGGTAAEVAQRVFASFPIDHPHYRATQSVMFQSLLTLIMDKGKVPTFQLLHELISNDDVLVEWLKDYEQKNPSNHSYLNAFHERSHTERMNEVSGLDANLMHFVAGESAALFNTIHPQINFDEVLEKGQICYFQLPTMYCPFLAEATGKLVLQCFQHAVAKRQLYGAGESGFFSCFLDDFQDYIYPGFAALLNKSRSANVGVVFSHQALGDLDKVGPEFRNVVTTCTNIKVVMRSNDPDTCDFYAKTFGTNTSEKVTERQQKGLLVTTKTGEGSVREVEAYRVHPNALRTLERGSGVISIPHPKGVCIETVRFQMRPNLPVQPLPDVDKNPKPASVETMTDTLSSKSPAQIVSK